MPTSTSPDAPPTPSRQRRLPWLAAGFLILALAALLKPGSGEQIHDPVRDAIHDAAHLPGFFLLTLALGAVLARRGDGAPRPRPLLTLFLALALGALTEWLQPLVQRQASWSDLIANTLGVLLASLWWGCHRLETPYGRVLSIVLVVSTLAATLLPPVLVLNARRHHLARFPDFLTHERPRAAEPFWRKQGGAAVEPSPLPDPGFLIDTKPGKWSGLSYWTPQSDWSGYATLVLELENTGAEPFELGLRLDDAASEDHATRAHAGEELAPGRHTLRLDLREWAQSPRGRPLDLERIIRLALFVSPDDPERRFSVKGAFLE